MINKNIFLTELENRQKLSKEQSDVLGAVQSTFKQCDDIDSLIEILTYALENYGYKNHYSILNKNEEFDNVDISCDNLEQIIANQSINDGSNFLLPIRGKNSLQKKIEFPDNKNCVLGVLNINNQKIKKKDMAFIFEYGKISGLQIHRLMGDKIINEQKEKIEAQNDATKFFAELIEHDIQTPLTIIQLYSEILQDETPKGSMINDSLKEIYGAGLRIDDILKLTKYFTSEITPEIVRKDAELINLWNFTDNAINSRLKKQSKSQYDIFLSIDKDLTIEKLSEQNQYINANKVFFNFIFNNLIGNALNYTRQTGNNKNIILSLYRQNGDLVIDTLNSIEKKITSYELENSKKRGIRLNTSNKLKSGAGIGLGVYMIDRFIKEGYCGNLILDSKDSINLSQVFDSTKKNYTKFPPIKNGENLENILPNVLDTFYRSEIRIPEEMLISYY